MNIIQTIENDIVAVWHIAEGAAVKFGAILWQDAQPVLKTIESEIFADLRTVILGLLTAYEGKDLPTIETAMLNVLSAGESALLAEAEKLGSALLQLLIAHVRADS